MFILCCCNTNYYPYKNSDNTYTCYLETDPIVITNRYYLTSNNVFVECDISCSFCEGPSNSECKQSKDFPQDCNSWMDAMMAINYICRNLQNNFIKYK